MNLIDWGGVAKNALWILGLAVILAALSYADWWAATNQKRLIAVLRTPLFQTPFNLGLTLFAAGLALSLIHIFGQAKLAWGEQSTDRLHVSGSSCSLDGYSQDCEIIHKK